MANEDPQNYWQNPTDEQGEQVEIPGADSGAESIVEPTPLPIEDTPENPPVTWTAQEYVHLDRSPLWFVIFSAVVLGFIAIDFFVLQSWTFSALVIVMAIALVIYIRRPPRLLTYALSPMQGLYVGERLYLFDEFKAFGLIKDGPHFSILLIPRKRFSPGVSVFFPDEAGERIVDVLGQRLPMENLKLDVVDVIVRKLRL
ncbi:MAG: hypothetical protein ACOH18_04240 [Candidatus Saccharimonadaceae bacterium]